MRFDWWNVFYSRMGFRRTDDEPFSSVHNKKGNLNLVPAWHLLGAEKYFGKAFITPAATVRVEAPS
jgi:hypothetical protein